jgi:4-carboxymuconolactone decarboxylase
MSPSDDARRADGERVRREVLGDEYVDRAQSGATSLTADFQDFITRVAWGDVWSRDGLDRRTRSAITVAVLVALGRTGELELHLRGARRNGLTDAEIAEILLHVAVYAGVPAANAAFAVARRVLEADA